MSYASFIWRNLARSPARSILTAAAVALTVLLACLLLSMPAGLARVLDEALESRRVAVHARAGLLYGMPQAYLARVRRVPGVEAAVSMQWFGGVYDANEGVTFANLAVDADSIATVYSDYAIRAGTLEQFLARRNAVLVGRPVLDRYGWTPGDLVTLYSPVFDLELEFYVAGAIEEDQQILWLQREYLVQALAARGRPLESSTQIWARIAEDGDEAGVLAALESQFERDSVRVTTLSESEFNSYLYGSLQGLVGSILMVTLLVSLCVALIAANATSMSIRERSAEVAVLRSLGFRGRTVFLLLTAETSALAVFAGLMGVLSAALATAGLRRVGALRDQFGPLATFDVDGTIVAQALLLSLVIGLAAGGLPSWRAARAPVSPALREAVG